MDRIGHYINKLDVIFMIKVLVKSDIDVAIIMHDYYVSIHSMYITSPALK